MNGWRGQALYIDLGRGSVYRRPLSPELLAACLGGRGLGVRLLRDHATLAPDNPQLPLIFAAGPLAGSSVPASDRLAVVSRSPLTGTIFDCSAGGRFAADLHAAGLDALVISGRSEQPLWLRIRGESVDLEPAAALRGKSTDAVHTALSGHGSVATIGPAGETGVRFAGILFADGNAAGRGGLGALMGSKGLKAISIQGEQSATVADPQRLEKANRDILRLFRASPILYGEFGLKAYGTSTFVDLMAQRCMTPTCNFRETSFPGSHNYSGPALRRAEAPVAGGCNGCPIACKKFRTDGTPLPEYGTLSHLGALNGIDDLATLLTASTSCRQLGLDPLSTGATLAAHAEISGDELSATQLLPTLAAIAHREGEGDLLAEGACRLADRLGRPQAAMTVKSLELPAFDPRGGCGLALAYALSGRGGCHTRGNPLTHEILRRPVPSDRFSFAGKARMLCIAENAIAALDSLCACRNVQYGTSLEEYAEALSAVTGCDYSGADLAGIGARIVASERAINLGNGFSANDDLLPERFFTEAGSRCAGQVLPPLDREGFLAERRTYYRLRGLTDDGRIPEAAAPEIRP